MRYGPIPSALMTHRSATGAVAGAGLPAPGGVDAVGDTGDPEGGDGTVGVGDPAAVEVGTRDADADSFPRVHPATARVSATAVTVIQILTLLMCSPGSWRRHRRRCTPRLGTGDLLGLPASCHSRRAVLAKRPQWAVMANTTGYPPAGGHPGATDPSAVDALPQQIGVSACRA